MLTIQYAFVGDFQFIIIMILFIVWFICVLIVAANKIN